MPIHRQFGSEISLTSLHNKFDEDGDLANEAITCVKKKCGSVASFSTVATEETSLDGSEIHEDGLPKSILKASSNPTEAANDAPKSLPSWMDQPLPETCESAVPLRRHRDRIASTSSKYDRVKTRFPGSEEKEEEQKERSITTRRARKPHPEKTLKEEWVKTCRFVL